MTDYRECDCCIYCEETPCSCPAEPDPEPPPADPLGARWIATYWSATPGQHRTVQILADRVASLEARLAVLSARSSIGGLAEALDVAGGSLLELWREGDEWVACVRLAWDDGPEYMRCRHADPERAAWTLVEDVQLARLGRGRGARVIDVEVGR